MTRAALSRTAAVAVRSSRAHRRLGMPLVAGVVVALLLAGGGREPRFRELGLVVGG